MGVLVGVASLQLVCLWEWPAFSGCACGNGEPSVGVDGEEKRREGVGGKERDRRFQKDSIGFQ